MPSLPRLQFERMARPRQRREAQQQPDFLFVCTLEHGRLGVEAEHLRGPPEVGLEDLSDVHSAWHAERIEDDVDRTSVGKERHVLLGNDARDDTLVAVAAGHLVAHRNLALLGEIHLHELDHARRKLIGLQDPVDALFGLLFDPRLLFVRGFDDFANALVHPLVLDAERLEIERRET